MEQRSFTKLTEGVWTAGCRYVLLTREGSDEKRLSFHDGKLQYPRGSLEHDAHHFLKGFKLRSFMLERNPDLRLFWDSRSPLL